MPFPHDPASSGTLALWGGLECTINRVNDLYHNQLERNGHLLRDDDIDRFAALGISALRYPVLWESVAPDGLDRANWALPDARLKALRDHGITPIAGLVHHGSGPRHTHLLDPAFAPQLAEYAAAVARRYPWLEWYTPVNEPLTTARFCALYGVWYPHARDDKSFVQALLNECKATVLAMQRIREVNPHAKLVQTDDLGRTEGTQPLTELVEFYNERRWLSWDLLCGRVGPEHPLWGYLMKSEADRSTLDWLRDHPCPPDIIGINHYVTSDRWLDHRLERFPQRYRGGAYGWKYVDIEASRAVEEPIAGVAPLLLEAHERYGLPLAVTEIHIDARRDDQIRWLLEAWQGAQQARQLGADVRAVTVWALLGSYDWNCLVTECRGYYEPGPYDLRCGAPRPTALARVMQSLASGKELDEPILHGEGWWRRPGRLLCTPQVDPGTVASLSTHRTHGRHARPLLVTGADGALGRAFVRLCKQRQIAFVALDSQALDIDDAAEVKQAIAMYRPWAVVNTVGSLLRCEGIEGNFFQPNVQDPTVLADACTEHAVGLLTFSEHGGPAKGLADALVARTSHIFDPWEGSGHLDAALDALQRGETFEANGSLPITPAYLPDLVHECLDLLIDGERGVWQLTHGESITWAEWVRRAAVAAGIDVCELVVVHGGAEERSVLHRRNDASTQQSGQRLGWLDRALVDYVEQFWRPRDQTPARQEQVPEDDLFLEA